MLSAQARLIITIQLPAYYSAAVPVKVKGIKGSVLLEPEDLLDDCLQVDESLVESLACATSESLSLCC